LRNLPNISIRYLALWLWPPLIQRELDNLREIMNKRPQRKQREKILPSGVSPNIAYTLYEKYGRVQCLQPVDVQVVEEIMEVIRGDQDPLTDWGVPDGFGASCEAALVKLRITQDDLTMQNIWFVFAQMLPLIPNQT
jgi:hypothetical protein